MELLTTAEVCKLLKIHRKTLLKLTKENKFPPPLMLGKCKRWTIDSIRYHFEQANRGDVINE